MQRIHEVRLVVKGEVHTFLVTGTLEQLIGWLKMAFEKEGLEMAGDINEIVRRCNSREGCSITAYTESGSICSPCGQQYGATVRPLNLLSLEEAYQKLF